LIFARKLLAQISTPLRSAQNDAGGKQLRRAFPLAVARHEAELRDSSLVKRYSLFAFPDKGRHRSASHRSANTFAPFSAM